MVSDKKRLEIAKVVYANVASDFALFMNPKYRGEKFTWDTFVAMEEERSSEWMFIHDVKGNKVEIAPIAKTYAAAFAGRPVELATK
jgi:hypothetical protein